MSLPSPVSPDGARARRWRDDVGATLVEYGIMAALVAVVAIAAVGFLGRSTCASLASTGTAVAGVTGGPADEVDCGGDDVLDPVVEVDVQTPIVDADVSVGG